MRCSNQVEKQLPAFRQQSWKEVVNLPATPESRCKCPDIAHTKETDGCEKNEDTHKKPWELTLPSMQSNWIQHP